MGDGWGAVGVGVVAVAALEGARLWVGVGVVG